MEVRIPVVTHDITVIGGSAGGVSAVREVLRALPPDHSAAIFIVLHQFAGAPASLLANVFDRACELPVIDARDGQRIVPGRVYVAPPDHHLLLEPEVVRLSHGPRENGYRPSIDVLFRSAAVAFGARVTGVILSGMLDDGAAGLWAIRQRGGHAIVQDPGSAEYPDMPRNAMAAVAVDDALPAHRIAARLVELAARPVEVVPEPAPAGMVAEVAIAAEDAAGMALNDQLGERSTFTCPECGGALWEMATGAPRFRCHVGHAYALHTLAAHQSVRVEAALWAALRSLEESERLNRRLAEAASSQGRASSGGLYADNAHATAAHAQVLRDLLREPLRPTPHGVDPRADVA